MSLTEAERDAQSQSPVNEHGSIISPCAESKSNTLIYARLVGEDDHGIENILITLQNDKQREMRSKTDALGFARFYGLQAGKYQLSLPQLDEAAWEIQEKKVIALSASDRQRQAAWQSPLSKVPTSALTHIVKQGDCVAKLAHQYGFASDTIWQAKENESLRQLRADRHLLAPGDELFIPALRPASREVQVSKYNGIEIVMRRNSVPARLIVRYLNYDASPRAQLDYTLEIRCDDEQEVELIQGQTDADGYIKVAIPNHAVQAKISLGGSLLKEEYIYQLGCLDPIDTVGGMRARLKNLGYNCGATESVDSKKISTVMKLYQRVNGLEISEQYDSKMEESLLERYLS